MEKFNTKRSARRSVSKHDAVFVGLDVHKRSIYAAMRINGAEVSIRSLPADAEAVVKFLDRYRPGLKRVVYEAGPTVLNNENEARD